MSDRISKIPSNTCDNVASKMASITYRLDQLLRETTLRKLDLTYIHFRVLQYLYDEDGRQIGEIAQAVSVRQPVLTRVVDQMEERQLVQRQTDRQDSRRMRVYLTDLGRNRYEVAWPSAEELLSAALKGVSARECQSFKKTLEKIINNLV
ncbi:MarR family transcriptional regulator [Alcaligenes] [Alcaligenes phenolicus]